MKTLMPLLSLFLIVHHLQARLGETEAQIEIRYGKPYKVDPVGFSANDCGKWYSHDDVTIIVHYYNGVSHYEAYRKNDGEPFTPKEIELLLSVNKPAEYVWNPFPKEYANPQFLKQWYLSNVQKTKIIENALYYPNNSLVFETRVFSDYLSKSPGKGDKGINKSSGF